MKPKPLLATWLLAIFALFTACSGNDKSNQGNAAIPAATEKSAVPSIDIASLKTEPAILDAMQQVVDARLADEKKQKDDPGYSGHYLELTKLYTEVLKATTAYMGTLTDPQKAIEFNNKVSAIQDKMYGKQ